MTARQWFYRNIYRKTRYWKAVRRRTARRANYACQVKGCTARGPHFDAHHTKYILFMEWLLPWILVYLCRKHHDQVHQGFALTLKSGRRLAPFKLRRVTAVTELDAIRR